MTQSGLKKTSGAIFSTLMQYWCSRTFFLASTRIHANIGKRRIPLSKNPELRKVAVRDWLKKVRWKSFNVGWGEEMKFLGFYVVFTMQYFRVYILNRKFLLKQKYTPRGICVPLRKLVFSRQWKKFKRIYKTPKPWVLNHVFLFYFKWS